MKIEIDTNKNALQLTLIALLKQREIEEEKSILSRKSKSNVEDLNNLIDEIKENLSLKFK